VAPGLQRENPPFLAGVVKGCTKRMDDLFYAMEAFINLD
jgi:hypothetical protein